MVEALKKFTADLEFMPKESDAFRGVGVYSKNDWETWLRWVSGQLNPPTRTAHGAKPLLSVIAPAPEPPPSPFSSSLPPANLAQFIAQTMQQANRDLAALKFYVKAGQTGSATFYRDLIQRRYPDSLYSQQAEQLVREMKPPPAPEKGKVRIGQVIFVGNDHLPDAVLRQALALYPGQEIELTELPLAEKRLNRLKDTGIHFAATVGFLDNPGGYRDLLVEVRELLSDVTRTDLRKLQGAWTVVGASLQGSDLRALSDADFVFKGNELTATTKDDPTKKHFNFLLNPSAQPKEIRLYPLDGTSDGRPALGTYELKDDTLQLRVRPDKDTAPATASTRMMEFRLKRK